MNLIEAYKQASERAESYRNILEEIVKQCDINEDSLPQSTEFQDVLGVAVEMLSADNYDRKIIDMPPGSYSVRAEEECNPDCLNVGTDHEECIGVRGEWLPKLLPGTTTEVICTIREDDWE